MFTFSVKLELSEDDLKKLLKDHKSAQDLEGLKEGLADFQQELSTVEGLSQIISELDLFNF